MHMIRPTFPGYAAYPYQGPRLMSRIEGLVPEGTAGLERFEAPLVFGLGSEPSVGKDLTVNLWVRHLAAGALGVGVGVLQTRGGQSRRYHKIAAYTAGAQGLAALASALFPPSELATIQVPTGPNNTLTNRVVPVTITRNARLALAGSGAALLLAAWFFQR